MCFEKYEANFAVFMTFAYFKFTKSCYILEKKNDFPPEIPLHLVIMQ